jgi:outer membrane murein-binding lipoprotein Lpp
MSTECRPSAASSPAPIELSSPRSKRRIDRIDEPARPLGAKRAALQVRRQRTARPAVRPTARDDANRENERSLISKDNAVAFNLRATALGVLIERTQGQPVGARLVQTMVFADVDSFDRWCASEPIRFEDPVLYDQLRRQGHEAFGGKR